MRPLTPNGELIPVHIGRGLEGMRSSTASYSGSPDPKLHMGIDAQRTRVKSFFIPPIVCRPADLLPELVRAQRAHPWVGYLEALARPHSLRPKFWYP